MALTPNIQVPTAKLVAAAEGATLQAATAKAIVAANFPTAEIRSPGAKVVVAAAHSPDIEVSSAKVIVAGRGRVANPRLRAWTFTLDGHDFYVLRLGDDETIVYDVYSKQWMDWGSEDFEVWRANIGTTWPGGLHLAYEYGSDIVVGDDTYGLLWLLDPQLGVDQAPDATQDIDRPFVREAMSQAPIRGRAVLPCNVVYLTADLGAPAFTGASVTLYTSDDSGNTFQQQDTIVAVAADYTQEFAWRSLGQISAPGRLFKIVDDGAFSRIDGMEMNDDAG